MNVLFEILKIFNFNYLILENTAYYYVSYNFLFSIRIINGIRY